MNKIVHVSLLLLVFLIAFPYQADAARVDILPRKLLIEDRQRSGEITVVNMGNAPNHVRIEIVSYRQDEKGIYQDLKEPLNAAFDPEQVIRISPRQFTLPPGGRQKVRFTVQRPAELPDGEYRFHVMAKSFDEGDFTVRRKVLEKGAGAGAKVNVAFAIPVIVRKGSLTTAAKIKDVTFVPPSQSRDGRPALRFKVVREGTAGLMGTVQALQSQPGSSEPKQVGLVSNLNVFSEVGYREVEMPLRETLGPGPIRLIYKNDFGDKGVLDELVLEQ